MQDVCSNDNYQSLHTTALARKVTPGHVEPNEHSKSGNVSAAPIYQVVEEEKEGNGSRPQSPIYQTVESEATYQELESATRIKDENNIYTGIEKN